MLFQNLARGAENLTEPGSVYCFARSRKINLVDLKKVANSEGASIQDFLSLLPTNKTIGPGVEKMIFELRKHVAEREWKLQRRDPVCQTIRGGKNTVGQSG